MENKISDIEYISANYEKVWDFSEELAAVADTSNKVGFIDNIGKLVIPMMEVDYKSGYYSFENGIAVMEASDIGLKGAINKEGRWVLPMEFYNIYYRDDSGFMKVSDGVYWGLYDSEGNQIFPIIYADIYYERGFSGVFIQKDCNKKLVTESSKVIEPFIVDGIQPLRYVVNYKPGSESEYVTHQYPVYYNIEIYHGVLDTRTGRIVISAVYDKVEMVSKDLISASFGIENIETSYLGCQETEFEYFNILC